jgi:hypothetical protein
MEFISPQPTVAPHRDTDRTQLLTCTKLRQKLIPGIHYHDSDGTMLQLHRGLDMPLKQYMLS